MKLLACIAFMTLLSEPARAGVSVLRVGPDPCPAPADAVPYAPPADVAAENLNDWRRLSADVLVLKDIRLYAPGGPPGGLFARFAFDAETGEMLGVRYPDPPCVPGE